MQQQQRREARTWVVSAGSAAHVLGWEGAAAPRRGGGLVGVGNGSVERGGRLATARGEGIWGERRGRSRKNKTDARRAGRVGRSPPPGVQGGRRCRSAGWDGNSQSGGAVARQVSPGRGMLPRGDRSCRLPRRAAAGRPAGYSLVGEVGWVVMSDGGPPRGPKLQRYFCLYGWQLDRRRWNEPPVLHLRLSPTKKMSFSEANQHLHFSVS
jgi:hypothetical protein